jgi:hypothetical protein
MFEDEKRSAQDALWALLFAVIGVLIDEVAHVLVRLWP